MKQKQFSVNLSTVFTEVPFLERFRKAREHGFTAVECQFPYDYSIEDIQQELTNNELSMVLINLPPGDWKKGDRGIAIDPNRKDEFRKSVDIGIQYAYGLNVPRIHCMAGIVSQVRDESAQEIYLENLQYAASLMAKYNLTLLIEPINAIDMPGYFLRDLHHAEKLLKQLNLPNVKLQFDFYHIDRIYGETLLQFEQYAELIDHVQIADNPGRNEPGTGIIDYPSIFQYLNDNYKGHIGIEFHPLTSSEESFEWLKNIQ